jgi:hypothetical protein
MVGYYIQPKYIFFKTEWLQYDGACHILFSPNSGYISHIDIDIVSEISDISEVEKVSEISEVEKVSEISEAVEKNYLSITL